MSHDKDTEDRIHDALSELAGLDTHDMDMRNHPKAYAILDRLMQHAYAQGREDQAEACANPLPAGTVQRIWDKCSALDLDRVAFAWHVQRECAKRPNVRGNAHLTAAQEMEDEQD